MRSKCAPLLAAMLMASPIWAEAPQGDAPKPEVSAARPKPRPAKDEKDAKESAKKDGKCEEHGVSKKLCSRCNPKLEPVFKAKGDWCAEHTRPESQCVLCHPDLEKKGVK